MEPEFDREAVFDDDYLYFYADRISPEQSEADVELIWRLLELEPGLGLLDLACGHGRIANRLAERGVRVTGLDATPRFLELARADAVERGVEVEYVEGDMRSLPWSERFDRVLSWFSSFGYFGDEEDRGVLREAHKVLKPGGLLAVETVHRDGLLPVYSDEVVTERNGDQMIDRHRFDIQTSRSFDERTYIRGGKQRTFEFSVRMLTAAELRSWMLGAGFSEAFAYGDDGEPLTLEHRRMTIVGRK